MNNEVKSVEITTSMVSFSCKETLDLNERRTSDDCIDSRLSQEVLQGIQEEFDGEILVSQLMLDRTWQTRRLIWSKESIYFKREDDDRVMDSIPFTEIDEIVHSSDFESSLQHSESTGRLQESAEAASERSTLASTNAARRYMMRSSSFVRMLPSEGSYRHRLGRTQSPRTGFSGGATSVESPGQTGGQRKVNLPVIHIRTIPEGSNAGRAYCVRAITEIDCRKTVALWVQNSRAAKKKKESKTVLQRCQAAVRKVYRSSPFQLVASTLIMMNFAFTIAEAQLNKQLLDQNRVPTPLGEIFDCFDIFFLCCFSVELALNLVGHWFWPFIRDRYNIVDLLVILLSMIALGPWGLPMSVIRLIRSFRVVRLLSRFKALREIISALLESIIPVANAFTILLLIISVYSIIGVTYFDTSSLDDFAEFDKAFIALFQVVSSNTWIDSLPTHSPEGSVNFGNVLFLISFILLVGWTLLPISMAVLLNSFFLICERVEKEEVTARNNEARRADSTAHPMDPLLENITRNFVDGLDLSNRLCLLFKRMDENNSNNLSFQELCQAFRKLDYNPKIYISESDLASITMNGSLCNHRGCIGVTEFDKIMRNQIYLFAQRTLSRVLKQSGDESFAQLAAIKIFSVHFPNEGMLPASSSGSCEIRCNDRASREPTWQGRGTKRVMRADIMMDDISPSRDRHCNPVDSHSQGSDSAEPNPTPLFSKYHSLDDLRDMFRTILVPLVQELMQAQHPFCGRCHCVNRSSTHHKSMPKKNGLDKLHVSASETNCDAQMCEAEDSCAKAANQIGLLGANAFLEDSCNDVPWHVGPILLKEAHCILSETCSSKLELKSKRLKANRSCGRSKNIVDVFPQDEPITLDEGLPETLIDKPLIYSQMPTHSIHYKPNRSRNQSERKCESESSGLSNTTKGPRSFTPRAWNAQIALSSSPDHKKNAVELGVYDTACAKDGFDVSDSSSESSSGSTISRLAHSARLRLAVRRQEAITVESSDNTCARAATRAGSKDRRKGTILAPCLRKR